MKLLAFILLLLSTIAEAQTGVISGNAFWKYNDYVGNKPDAAAMVYLFPKDSTFKKQETQCDVSGNFRFDNIPPGSYLVAIRSKNTTTSGVDNFIQLRYTPTKQYLGFQLTELNPKLLDSIEIYKDEYDKAQTEKIKVFAINKWEKNIQKKRQAYYDAVKRLLREIPTTMDNLNLELMIPYHKVFLKEIDIKANQTTTVIADFGITYF